MPREGNAVGNGGGGGGGTLGKKSKSVAFADDCNGNDGQMNSDPSRSITASLADGN